ncbi:MAG: hypothetical protein LYZ69_01425 [Nitrososphaerales archaeon]|nr:hypothetical protein [Nitrososphaerales archaeon]
MAAEDGEPLELCEQCGSPLVDGACQSCGSVFRDGSSPVGAAPLDRNELSKVLGRPVGSRAHGSYSLSMQQEERMSPLRKEIESLVEKFNASPEVKNTVKQNAEKAAVKIMGELGPTKAAIASVAQEFISQGRNLGEVCSSIAKVHPGMDRLKDLVVEVYPSSEGRIRVLVDGRERPFRSYACGLYCRLRTPLFASDSGALVELRNAVLTRRGFDEKRVEPLGPSEFQITTDERNFELFKVLEEARLSGRAACAGASMGAMFRKYSISKLRLTSRLLREAGLLQQVSAEYAKLYARSVGNGLGRSPRKLAEEALIEACEDTVPEHISSSIAQKYHLKRTEMRSLVVQSELDAWQS